jgi:LmbE family N-acetylglucosaminyl deacetylase
VPSPAADTTLWVGAHPDDEVLVAAFLGALRSQGERVILLVLTRGENGVCRLPAGCLPDLARVREREMQLSARRLGAQLHQWRLGDVNGTSPEDVFDEWARQSAGIDALERRLRRLLVTQRPDRVVSFDPGHGSTCHPAHRATSWLVSRVVQGMGQPKPSLLWLETVPEFRADGTVARFRAAKVELPGLFGFDVRRTWPWSAWLASAHPSQFGAEVVESLRALRSGSRITWLAPAASQPSLQPTDRCR